MASPRSVIALVVNYLDGQRGAGVDAEGIDVAIQCLVEAFGVTKDDRSGMGSEDLGAIVAAHLRTQSTNPRGTTATSLPATMATADDVEGTPLFRKYLDMVTAKGLFRGAEPGSAEYAERYKKVVDAFRKRSGPGATTGDGAAVAPAAATTAAAATAATVGTASSAPVPEADEAAAEELKTEGNGHMSKERWAEAIDCYTAAIAKVDGRGRNVHVYYANRAAAKTSAKDYDGAVVDAGRAIEVNPSFAKGHARLGAALQGAGKYREAVGAYEQALRLDPSNATTKENLAAAQAAMRSAATAATVASSRGGSGGGGGGARVPPSGLPPMGFPGMGMPPGLEGMMNNPMLAGLLNNPAIQQMAQSVMSNPSMMANMMSMMGGGRGGGDGARGDMPDLSGLMGGDAMDRLHAAMDTDPELAELKSDPEVEEIMAQVQREGPSSLFRHMNNPKMQRIVTKVLGSVGAPGGLGSGVDGDEHGDDEPAEID